MFTTKIKSAFFAMAVIASLLAGFETANAQNPNEIPVLERATETTDGKFDQFSGKMTTVRVFKVSQVCNPFQRRCVTTETEIQTISLTDWFHWIVSPTGGHDLAKGVVLQSGESLKVVIAGEGIERFKSFYFRLGREVGDGATGITAQVYGNLRGDSAQTLANLMWLQNGAFSGMNHWQTGLYAGGLEFGESNDLGADGAKVWQPLVWNDLPTQAMTVDGVDFITTYRVYGTLPLRYRSGESSVTIVVNNPTNRRALFCGLGVSQIQQ